MIKFLENHSNQSIDLDFNQITGKIKNGLMPVVKFFHKLDKIRDGLNKNINEYFRDNLLALLIMSKDSGKVLYNHIRDELISADLVGGFLTAIQDFGNELFSKDSPIRELSYRDFKIKIEEGKYTKVVIILLNNPNELIAHSISERMRDFIISFELIYRTNLECWNGRTDLFEDADSLFKEFFFYK
ncbi:MAG: hypothetical protein ACFFCM_16845 [Promethearchaeota archaeon]